MCARYTLTAEEKELIAQGNYTLDGPYVPDPNIAVTDFGFVVTSAEPDVVQRMYWGIDKSYASFNIRSEDVLETPNFNRLLQKRNFCIIFADGFYESEELTKDDKRPWRFITERKIFAFLGLWTESPNVETGELEKRYAILTCKANKTVGEIHPYDRMPVILSKADEDFVLHKKPTIEQFLALCVPYPDRLMNCYRVSKDVLPVSTKEKWNKSMELLKEVPDEPRVGNLFGDAMPPADITKRTFKNTAKKKPKKNNDPPPPPLDLFNSK
jgi:putative SOS response-associated peptidase YedK